MISMDVSNWVTPVQKLRVIFLKPDSAIVGA